VGTVVMIVKNLITTFCMRLLERKNTDYCVFGVEDNLLDTSFA
jgi:hypothetical protein